MLFKNIVFIVPFFCFLFSGTNSMAQAKLLVDKLEFLEISMSSLRGKLGDFSQNLNRLKTDLQNSNEQSIKEQVSDDPDPSLTQRLGSLRAKREEREKRRNASPTEKAVQSEKRAGEIKKENQQTDDQNETKSSTDTDSFIAEGAKKREARQKRREIRLKAMGLELNKEDENEPVTEFNDQQLKEAREARRQAREKKAASQVNTATTED